MILLNDKNNNKGKINGFGTWRSYRGKKGGEKVLPRAMSDSWEGGVKTQCKLAARKFGFIGEAAMRWLYVTDRK